MLEERPSIASRYNLSKVVAVSGTATLSSAEARAQAKLPAGNSKKSFVVKSTALVTRGAKRSRLVTLQEQKLFLQLRQSFWILTMTVREACYRALRFLRNRLLYSLEHQHRYRPRLLPLAQLEASMALLWVFTYHLMAPMRATASSSQPVPTGKFAFGTT